MEQASINNTDNCHFALVYLLGITRLTFIRFSAQEPSIVINKDYKLLYVGLYREIKAIWCHQKKQGFKLTWGGASSTSETGFPICMMNWALVISLSKDWYSLVLVVFWFSVRLESFITWHRQNKVYFIRNLNNSTF